MAALLALPGAGWAGAPAAEAGRRIWTTGESPGGGEITALVGADRTAVPGAVLPCAGCHGEDGLGRPEGGVIPSNVTWSELTRPAGHAHPGRSHGPFDERSLALAVTEGIDPAGQALDAVMPRYSLSRQDLEALIAWMKVLELQADPGLGATTIRLATVLPGSGRLGEVGQAMRAALQAAVDEVNAGGGVNGRRLELMVATFDPGRESPVAALRRLQAATPAFALVSGLAPGSEADLAAWAEAERIPLVGPFTPFTRPSDEGGHWTFYLLPGLREQARVLAEHAASGLGLTDARLAILRPAGEPAFEAAAEAARAQAERRGLRHVEVAPLGADGPSEAEVARLAALGIQVVVLLGDDAALAGLLARAAAAGWSPWVLAPGTLAARAAAAAPAAFADRLRLSYPSLPTDETAEGRARLARLGAGGAHHAPRAAALASMAILCEGLKRAGKQLSRARLVEGLEGLYQAATGLGPSVSFGPSRRVGAMGGYVVAVDLAAHAFHPVGGWVRLD